MSLQLHKNLYFYILFLEIEVCFLLQMNEDNLNNKSNSSVLTLFLLIMQIALLPQDNVSLLFIPLESLIELFAFYNSN